MSTRNLNRNSELSQTGVERLLKALATDVSVKFDDLHFELHLPNPMEILTDLFGFSA